MKKLSEEDQAILASPTLDYRDAERIARKMAGAQISDDYGRRPPIIHISTVEWRLVGGAYGGTYEATRAPLPGGVRILEPSGLQVVHEDPINRDGIWKCSTCMQTCRPEEVHCCYEPGPLVPAPMQPPQDQKVAAAQSPNFSFIFNAKVPSLNPPPFDVACSRVHQVLMGRINLHADKAFVEELVRAAQVEFDRSSIEDPIKRADRALAGINNRGFGGMSEREIIAKEILDAERIAFQCGRNETDGSSSNGTQSALAMRAACVKILDERIDNSRMYAMTRPYHKERLEHLEALKKELEQLKPEDLK